MMKFFKVISVMFLAILVIACVCIDSWYIYILKYGPDKVVSTTYEVGLQETTDGNTKYFMEINYFSNAMQNGLEMFEIKYNYMLDENQEAFYSQGLQYVANDKQFNLEFKDKEYYNQEATFLEEYWEYAVLNKVYGYFVAKELGINAKEYNYASSDDYKTPIISANPIGFDTKFKIQLGEELFLMKFKGKNTPKTLENALYFKKSELHLGLPTTRDYFFYFCCFDSNYFSSLMYDTVKKITPGTTKNFVFEFGDLFDYYKYNEDTKTYDETAYQNCDLIMNNLKSYYSIKVNVSENGAQKSSDSMFNMIHGSTTYNLTGNYAGDDYLYGRTIAKLDIYDFDFININYNNFKIKLKENVANFYRKHNVNLEIKIDLDILAAKGINFAGVVEDNGLEDFKILEFYTIKTDNGNIIKTEVMI